MNVRHFLRLLRLGFFVLVLGGTGVRLRAQASINEAAVVTVKYVDAASTAVAPTGGLSDPYPTLAQAVAWLNNPANIDTPTKVVIRPGIYREGNLRLSARTALAIFEGTAAGAVVISGADVWTNWISSGSDFYKPWTNDWGLAPEEAGANVGALGRRGEVVYIDDLAMRQVLTLGEMTDGSYFVDEAADRLYVRPPAGVSLGTVKVEVAVRGLLLRCDSTDQLVLRNLVFEKSANGAVRGGDNTYAVFLTGESDDTNPNRDFIDHVLIEDCVFQLCNSAGLTVTNARYFTFRRSQFIHNGNAGMSSNRCRYFLWEDCDLSYNNWRWGLLGGEYGWSPAGTKQLRTSDSIFRNCRFVSNYATGLWMDYGNEHTVVDGCVIANNYGNGLYWEANTGPGVVRRSLVRGNGHQQSAVNSYDGGIYMAESERLGVEDSLLIENNYHQAAMRPTGTNRRAVSYWSNRSQTGLSRHLDIRNSVLVGGRNDLPVPYSWYSDLHRNAGLIINHIHGSGDLFDSQSLPAYRGTGNTFYSPFTTSVFSASPVDPNNGFTKVTLATWLTQTSGGAQDADSVWSSTWQSQAFAASDAFQETNGVVVMEAENFQRFRKNGDTVVWIARSAFNNPAMPPAARNGLWLATPNAGSVSASTFNATTFTFRVNITTPGAYSLAYRSLGVGGSAHVSVDGSSLGYLAPADSTAWTWRRWGTSLGTLAAGVHEITVSRRGASGLNLDRFVVANASAKLPVDGDTSAGPDESRLLFGINAVTSGWGAGDIGLAATQPGRAIYESRSDTWSLTAGGSGVTGAADMGHFIWMPRSDDTEIVTRVTTLPGSQTGAQAGAMFRVTRDPNSAAVGLVLTPAGAKLITRVSAGATVTTVATTAVSAPAWLRLTRNGNTYRAYHSANGTQWALIGSTAVTLPTSMLAGLIASSGLDSSPATAVFTGTSMAAAPGLTLTDFNLAGALAGRFNETGVPGKYSEAANGGLNGTRAIDVNTDGSSGSRVGITSFPGATPSHTMSLFFKHQTATTGGGTPLYLGFGPTASYTVSLSTDAPSPIATNDHLLVGVQKDSTNIQSGRLVILNKANGTVASSTSAFTPLSPGQWYQLTATFTLTGGTYAVTATLHLADASGTLGAEVLTKTTSYANADLAASGAVYPFFGGQGNASQRGIDLIDNFYTSATESVPAAPSGLGAGALSDVQVDLAWTDNASDETAYKIERKTGASGTYAQIGQTGPGVTTYADDGLLPGTQYFYRVCATNAAGDSAYTSEVAVTTYTPLENWRLTYFSTAIGLGGAADTADPDGDGVVNLLEYALNLHPLVAQAGGLPTCNVVNARVALTFTRAGAARDVVYRVEASGDLSAWTEIWSSVDHAYGGGSAVSETVVVQDALALDAARPRRFMRLKITRI